jgi:hypothetical protein
MTENLESKVNNAPDREGEKAENGGCGALITGLVITAIATYIGQQMVNVHEASHLVEGVKSTSDAYNFFGLNWGGTLGLLAGLSVMSLGTEPNEGGGDGSHPDYEL